MTTNTHYQLIRHMHFIYGVELHIEVRAVHGFIVKLNVQHKHMSYLLIIDELILIARSIPRTYQSPSRITAMFVNCP